MTRFLGNSTITILVMKQTHKGYFQPQNPQKYVGSGKIIYRSSWELDFMTMCDNHSSVIEWASEPLRIPYRHPMSGKYTVYVPDFIVVYMDGNKKTRSELVEVKPAKQAYPKYAKTDRDKAALIVNMAKWKAATTFAKNNGLMFRVITENEMYHQGKK